MPYYPPQASATHALLDGSVHTDTAAQTVTRGSLVYGSSTPKWDELVIGAANRLLRSDGADVSWAQAVLTTDVTGTLPVANGGTGLTAGTSGGILGYTAAGTLASSAVLASGAMVLGGGAGATPTTNSNITVNANNQLNSSTQYRCQAYNNASQTVSTATFTTMNLNAEDFDVGTMHDNVTNNSRITIPTGGDGLYIIHSRVRIWPNTAVVVASQILKNGSPITIVTYNSSSTSGRDLIDFAVQSLVATDYIEFQGYHAFGSDYTITNGTRQTQAELAVIKLW